MKTSKVILRKILEWENNPMCVSGLYRLLVYLKWDEIPEKYQVFFPEEAKATWDDESALNNKKELLYDIEAEVRAVLQGLDKKNITGPTATPSH